jgi:hypothetical protein
MTRMLPILCSVALVAAGYFIAFDQYQRYFAKFLSASSIGPRCKAVEPAIDLGTAAPGEHREVRFLIENAGEDRLILNALVPECDCLRAEEPEKLIPAGQRVPLRVFLHVPANPGSYELTFKYAANDRENPVVSLIVRVTVDDPQLLASPERKRPE